jgi:uncharacterized protein YggL (DUF469 family)
MMSGSCPQLAFELAFHLDAPMSSEFWTAFSDFLGTRDLSCSGGTEGGGRFRYIIWRDGSQAEHADREAVREWAESRPAISEVKVGDLIDGEFKPSWRLDV